MTSTSIIISNSTIKTVEQQNQHEHPHQHHHQHLEAVYAGEHVAGPALLGVVLLHRRLLHLQVPVSAPPHQDTTITCSPQALHVK